MPKYGKIYAYGEELVMAKKDNLKRKAFFVDERTLRRAKKLLGLSSEGEVVRVAVERAVEMEEFWEFMQKTRGVLEPGSFEAP
jgi:hypothetical protein